MMWFPDCSPSNSSSLTGTLLRSQSSSSSSVSESEGNAKENFVRKHFHISYSAFQPNLYAQLIVFVKDPLCLVLVCAPFSV